MREVHGWRARRSPFGELVQWDTSEHDWLEGRGERLYLIPMIDDATSRLRARFVRHDTTEENLRMLRGWLESHGRMGACYTDRAAMFKTARKRSRWGRDGVGEEGEPLAPTPSAITSTAPSGGNITQVETADSSDLVKAAGLSQLIARSGNRPVAHEIHSVQSELTPRGHKPNKNTFCSATD